MNRTCHFATIYLVALGVLLAASCKHNKIKVSTGGNIESLEQVKLGGLEQWVLIRGDNKDKPVALFLHGGPGDAAIPQAGTLYPLEKKYVMVYWDQLGSGKSFRPDIPVDRMTVDNMIEFAHELTTLLKKRFNKKKIYLIGHSWGSMLGLLTISKYPEDYAMFMGIGQVIDFEKADGISYEWIKKTVADEGTKEEMEKLSAIGEPPWTYKEMATERIIILKHGGIICGEGDMEKLKSKTRAGRAKYYSEQDVQNLIKGSRFTLDRMWESLYDYHFLESAKKIDVPVLFLEGRCDKICPLALVKEYFYTLEAPLKRLVVFDNSAHWPFVEEPERFFEIVLSVNEEPD